MKHGPQSDWAPFSLQAPTQSQALNVHEAPAEEREVSAILHDTVQRERLSLGSIQDPTGS